ncbi:uncharacterized protein AMSG_00559 [Thecamonas trahens ATCC 50062]|uniref:Uncharacterized protein n=1 Tax=Thecamonas trahens ATCC 50062 TaxID=461836 RepID=A0A0L0D9N0_THETB|nr:hypothetical protein AMSG_00559 [Thecamonas trahens ATCC 50062]KNC48781.1 hypothetical protein AMSG_00559 [Thecamonas trahens ATCC 50062]|eukprot:XP_013762832.1 hypothetical protein AMSG_00559 [Thecamonas trahens ATCC 50062]
MARFDDIKAYIAKTSGRTSDGVRNEDRIERLLVCAEQAIYRLLIPLSPADLVTLGTLIGDIVPTVSPAVSDAQKAGAPADAVLALGLPAFNMEVYHKKTPGRSGTLTCYVKAMLARDATTGMTSFLSFVDKILSALALMSVYGSPRTKCFKPVQGKLQKLYHLASNDCVEKTKSAVAVWCQLYLDMPVVGAKRARASTASATDDTRPRKRRS